MPALHTQLIWLFTSGFARALLQYCNPPCNIATLRPFCPPPSQPQGLFEEAAKTYRKSSRRSGAAGGSSGASSLSSVDLVDALVDGSGNIPELLDQALLSAAGAGRGRAARAAAPVNGRAAPAASRQRAASSAGSSKAPARPPAKGGAAQ